jgi:hypothetical protein
MDPGTLSLSGIPSALGVAIKIAEKTFEILAVDEQARSILKTVDQVTSDLGFARTLRRKKSSLLTRLEKELIDATLRHTDEAVSRVAALAEPARADMDVSRGQIKFQTRLLCILRDSPRMQICLTQLGIAHQSLSRDLGTLCARQTQPPAHTNASVMLPPPPTYDEAMFISEQRQRNVRKRASALSNNIRAQTKSVSPPAEPELPPFDSSGESAEMGTGVDFGASVSDVLVSSGQLGDNIIYTLPAGGSSLSLPIQPRKGKQRRSDWLEAGCK